MKRALALAIAGGICLYCLLLFVYGPSGIYAYDYLSARKTAMEENVGAMRRNAEALNAQIERLGSDEDLIAQEARELGYIRENETIIVLEGKNSPPENEKPGLVIRKAESHLLSDQDCELYAALGALALFFVGILARGEREERRRNAEFRWD